MYGGAGVSFTVQLCMDDKENGDYHRSRRPEYFSVIFVYLFLKRLHARRDKNFNYHILLTVLSVSVLVNFPRCTVADITGYNRA